MSMGSVIQYLLAYLKRMQDDNASFFYAIEDDNEQLGNIFWADSNSQENYCYFGDTIRLDTSYRTNRSRMPIIAITGINHHAQPILFGCALILNESDNTFIWLLESFLQAMSDKSPISITCDPDRVIQMAVSQVLPAARTRFCRWSIFRQTHEKMSGLVQENPAFDFEFKKCVNEADTVEEFESSWATLLSRYFLIDDEWLQSLYNIRDQWIPVYLKDVFFGELSMVEPVDALSSLFEGCLPLSTSIQLLIKQYNKAIVTWHENEARDDLETSNSAPVLKTPSPMEKQAADVYTRRIFLKFQGELVETLANPANIIDESGTITTYRVAKFGEEKGHIVRFNAFQVKAACSCRMFEFSGIVCRHILSAFRSRNVWLLPDEYILKRWTKNAKAPSNEIPESAPILPHGYYESRMVRQNKLREEALKFVEEGSKSTHIYNVAMNALHETYRKVAAVRSKNGASSKETTNSESNGGNLEPNLSHDHAWSFLSQEEKKKRICELEGELERVNQRCSVYRTVLQSLSKDVEDQKLKLSVKVQNARLSLKE